MVSNAIGNSKDANNSWQVIGLQVLADKEGVGIDAASITWADDVWLTELSYRCPHEFEIFPRHACEQASVVFNSKGQEYQANISTQVDFSDEFWSIQASDSHHSIQIMLSSASEVAKIELDDVNLHELLQLNQLFSTDASFADTKFNGSLVFDWQQLLLSSVEPIKFSDLSYEYSDDIIVANLAGHLDFSLDIAQQKVHYELSIQAGEMLFDQLYVDFSSYPVNWVSDIKLADKKGWFDVQGTLTNEQSLAVQARALVSEDLQWQSPSFTAHVLDSHHFNQQILNSVLGIYGVADSEMSGQFTVSADTDIVQLDRWQIDFDDYYFFNEGRKIDAQGLSGKLNWHQSKLTDDSALSWQSMLMIGLPIGQANMNFNFSADQFKLLGSHSFPVFDGAIELDNFAAQKLFSEFVDMQIDANVLPISLKLITEKMGWPIMSGTISGDIPGMVKQGSVIEFLGALELKVFGGEMTVNNLSMERLFGVAPVIAGDVGFSGFDLALLTETFGFGLITGQLDGRVNELRITNWKTDRLDAQVYTVKVKGVKQIISQRAIENISSLGGIKGAISNTFLRFFDDFRYKKIKLSCKLHNSVCRIGGLKNQGNQFIIVEGGGIPKINIVGFVRSINWEEFISRLLNANYNN